MTGKKDNGGRRPSKVETSPEDSEARVRAAFRSQAEWCRTLGSPLTSLLCVLAADRLDRSTSVGEAILSWQGDPDAKADSVPLRFAGALNGLVRKGRLPALARLYPPNPLPDGEALWAAVAKALTTSGPEIEPGLDLARSGAADQRGRPLLHSLCRPVLAMGAFPLADAPL